MENIILQSKVVRCIEIAAAGGLSVGILNYPGGQGRELIKLAQTVEVDAHLFYPCPCGFLHLKRFACFCSNESISRHNFEILDAGLDIYVEVNEPKDYQVRAALFGENNLTYSRSWEVMQKRIDNMAQFESLDLCEAGQNLVIVSFSQFKGMGIIRAKQIIKVARVIANLAHSETITPVHLVEAIQYRPKLANCTSEA